MIGKSILSSIRYPQADLYRGLVGELAQRGHRTVFLECERPDEKWQRDMLRTPYCDVWTYATTDSLLDEYTPAIEAADIVILGSAVPEAHRIAAWIADKARGVKVYYDTDLARTLASLSNNNSDKECVSCSTVPIFDLYLSTTGGSALDQLMQEYGCRFAKPLYESIDPYFFYRTDVHKQYDLGFIGNFKPERDQHLEELLLQPARHTPNRRFVLAGDHYPPDVDWPDNLTYLEHLPETNHVDFYNRQHCSLVLAREDRRALGFTPSKRLLAAAACGVPILTHHWEGIEQFFEPQREVFLVEDCHQVLDVLYQSNEIDRRRVGDFARERVLAQHTTAHRTDQLLSFWHEIAD